MTTKTRTASLHRMVMPGHTCPYGLKALDLLRRRGYEVDDHWLTTREETDAFKAEHGVKTTPQVFIDGQRIGGYDDLRRHLGKPVAEPGATSYRPVVVFTGALWLVRSQRTVDDVAYMRAMIPHHSIAILTSERAQIRDPRVRKLADEILEAQRREIAEMKSLIAELERDAGD